jgi:hypothetical protein
MSRPRLHKSTLVVGLLVALVLVLIEVPGRVVNGIWSAGAIGEAHYEHGWPWVYRFRIQGNAIGSLLTNTPTGRWLEVRSDLPHRGVPWLSAPNWRFWENRAPASQLEEPQVSRFNDFLLLADGAVALAIVAVAVMAWEVRRRRRPRALSFRTSEMLIALTAVGMVLGWLVYLERERQREQAVVASFEPDYIAYYETCIAPRWLQSLVGSSHGLFWPPSKVWILVKSTKDADEKLTAVGRLKHVRRVIVQAGDGIRPIHFSRLQPVKSLENLDVRGYYEINAEDVAELSQLSRLQRLHIFNGIVPPALRERLSSALPNCEIEGPAGPW